jgi:hypothetical protein
VFLKYLYAFNENFYHIPDHFFFKLYSILLLYQGQILKKDDEQSPVKENQKVSEEHQQSDEDSDEDGDVVPIVIRPGHIRFERPGKGLSLPLALCLSLSLCIFFSWDEIDSSIFWHLILEQLYIQILELHC